LPDHEASKLIFSSLLRWEISGLYFDPVGMEGPIVTAMQIAELLFCEVFSPGFIYRVKFYSALADLIVSTIIAEYMLIKPTDKA
jgi:hypothetical protein